MSAPIPAWVVAGPLGCGKTTLIAQLLTEKPADENWAVLLNEFSDAGIDALTVAAAARGAYDVRMVPGGCICCVGEQDFRRNLLQLVAAESPPARIIVEPSGIGHPAGIVEELLMHQAAGGLRLEAVIGLVDADRVALLEADDAEPARAAAEIADVLALTKADRADVHTQQKFAAIANSLYPAKRWFGPVTGGVLPAAAHHALAQLDAVRLSTLPMRPALHAAARRGPEHEHAHDHEGIARTMVPVGPGERRDVALLEHCGAAWTFPRSVSFPRSLLDELPDHRAALRIKAVVRVAEDEWCLLQWVEGRVSVASTAWRRDNRIEVIANAAQGFEPAQWDGLWLQRLQAS